jgi:hypothetical protein
MSFHNLSISVLKVGRQLVGSLAVAAFFIFTTTGCLKEEQPVLPFDRGGLTTRSINLASDYRNQIYYSLEKDSIIRQNLKMDWDLAFEANTEGVRVFLNSSRLMASMKTNTPNIEDLKDMAGLKRVFDVINRPNISAIGDVRDLKNCFWIDRGLDDLGDPLDIVKVKFEGVTAKDYTLKVAKQNERQPTTIVVEKDPKVNLVYLSFTNNKVVKLDPPKEDWDLYFTQYLHYFNEANPNYVVTGAILNPNKTVAVADSSLEFKKIDINVAKGFKLTAQPDVIGYSWKNFANNIYTINNHWNYIIRDSKGFYYKLRFIDFYSEKGAKGVPKFEFQKL